MKKNNILIAGGILLLIILIGGFFMNGSKEKWVCKDGQWTRIGSPKTSQPKTQCPGKNPNADLPSIPPDSAVVSFYSWLQKNNALENDVYKTSPYLSDQYKEQIAQSKETSKVNLFVCSDILPTSYKITKSSANKNKAQIEIEQTFTTKTNKLSISLQAFQKQWQISDIKCL